MFDFYLGLPYMDTPASELHMLIMQAMTYFLPHNFERGNVIEVSNVCQDCHTMVL